MVKKIAATSSSQSNLMLLPSDEATVAQFLRDTIASSTSTIPVKYEIQKELYDTDSEENNKLATEALQALSPSNLSALQLEQQYTKVYQHLHNDSILENKIQVRQLVKSVEKATIEKVIKYLASQKNRLSSDKINVMAMRFHELLIHLTFIGKAGDMMQSTLVEDWLESSLGVFANSDADQKVQSKEVLIYATQSLRFLVTLVASFKELLKVIARTTYYQNIQIARANRLHKENKDRDEQMRNRFNKDDPNKVIDPEELMLQEMDKAEEEKMQTLDSEGDVDDFFDEEENPLLSGAKARLCNKRLLDLVLQVGEKNIQYLSNLPEDAPEEIEHCHNFISKLVIQYLIEVLDMTMAQTRYEEISSLMLVTCKSSFVPYITKFIEHYFEKDRSMLERALLLIISLLGNDKLIPVIHSAGLVDQVVSLLKKYIVRGEEGSKFSSYICSLSCYIIGKMAVKENTIATSLLNTYGKANNSELLVTLVTSLKANRAPTLKHMTLATYVALQGLLSGEGATEAILELNAQTEFLDMLTKDIKNVKDQTDTYIRDIRYHSMVLLKVICNGLIAGVINNSNESLKQQVAAIFEKIIDSGVLQAITDMIASKRNEKKPKKKEGKTSQKQEMEEGIFHRYTRFASIASANAIFQTSGKCNDETVRKKLVELISSDQKYAEILSFLNFMETKKVQKTMSPKNLLVIIIIFAIFLISLPILFNVIKKK